LAFLKTVDKALPKHYVKASPMLAARRFKRLSSN
jgi:hypothetical protein